MTVARLSRTSDRLPPGLALDEHGGHEEPRVEQRDALARTPSARPAAACRSSAGRRAAGTPGRPERAFLGDHGQAGRERVPGSSARAIRSSASGNCSSNFSSRRVRLNRSTERRHQRGQRTAPSRGAGMKRPADQMNSGDAAQPGRSAERADGHPRARLLDQSSAAAAALLGALSTASSAGTVLSCWARLSSCPRTRLLRPGLQPLPDALAARWLSAGR